MVSTSLISVLLRDHAEPLPPDTCQACAATHRCSPPCPIPAPDGVSLASETLRLPRDAQSLQKTVSDPYVAQDHILTALVKAPSMAPVLKEAGLTEAAPITETEQICGSRRIESRLAEQGFDALSKHAVDLTALAEGSKIDPVTGRDSEIRRVACTLCRR